MAAGVEGVGVGSVGSEESGVSVAAAGVEAAGVGSAGVEPLVVATGAVHECTHRILEGLARVVLATDEGTLRRLAPEAVGFIVRGDTSLSGELVASAPRLKVIGRSGVGVDNVDVAAATRRRIPVVVTPFAGVDAVAEGAFAMLLSLAKRLGELDAIVRAGRWSERNAARLGDLAGSTLGVVGMGRIGRRVVQLGGAFDMQVLVADPLVDPGEIKALGAEPATLEALFASAEFISLHAPLTPSTRGMITADLLAAAGPGAVLVNLARGALIESYDALLEALSSGALAGLGLDVFEPEPPDLSHSLFKHPQVLLSPHALGLTVKSRETIFRVMTEGIRAVLEGGRPEFVANPEIYETGGRG